MVGSRPSSTGRPSDVERIIVAAEVDTTFSGKKARYRGRRSTWPGALFLVLLILGSIGGLTYYGIALHDQVKSSGPSAEALAARYGSGTPISDGRPQGNTTEESIEVTNPESYKERNCKHPNWISKNGQIFYQLSAGKDVSFAIKGVNWMGMQDNRGVPKGLWDSSRDGSTLYRIGQFLVNNKFNAVRLPLSIDAVARNVEVDMSLINTNSNRALFADRYITLLGLIIQGLGNQGLGIVLDFHVLSAVKKEDNGLWTGTSIQMQDIKDAIGNLAEKLCTGKHFNIIGLDLKDSVQGSATWGDKSETDWAVAATELGNEVIKQCPQWLVFIQGVQGSPQKLAFAPEDRLLKTKFWPGADLSGVKDTPIELDESDKVVYAPQYFSNSKIPQPYFFTSGERAGDKISDYVESEDDLLKENIDKSMDYMFGPALESEAAVILSQFGGLVGDEDATEMKTSTRIIEHITEQMVDKKFAGGFWMALNPDTYWNYRVPDNETDGDVNGILETSWRKANMDVLTSLKPMDKMENLRFVPCIEQPE